MSNTHQILVYADDVNVFRESLYTINRQKS